MAAVMRAILKVELDHNTLEATWVPAGGGARPVVRAKRAVELEAIRTLCVDLARVLNRGSRWADGDQGSRAILRRKGEALFDTLLPGPVKAALRAAAEVGGELVIDTRGLAFVPWELLHTGFGFVGLTFAVGRADGQSLEHAAPASRMLVIADPRGDLIGSYYEGLTLRDDLSAAERIEVDLRSSEVGIADVRELIRDYDVVHYAGHAEPVEPDGERGWWLRDGVLGASAIRELGGGRAFPRLVFVNACRSARVEPEAGELPSLAEAFLEAGAQQVIGTVWDVPDEPASGFALAFYAQLMAGVTVGEAVRHARVTLAERYGEDSVYWAAWVLHGEPRGRFFAPSAVAEPLPASSIEPSRGLPEVAARVRGAAVAVSDVVVASSDGRRWLRLVTGIVALAAAIGLATSIRVADVPMVVRPARSADLGPIERVEPAGVATLGVGVSWGSDELSSLGLAAVVERADGKLAEVSELASGESFKLRWLARRAGWVSVWQVDSLGRVTRVFPTSAVMAATAVGRDVVWPSQRWLGLDENRGTEHFLIAWRERPPVDLADFGAEVEHEITTLEGGAVAERFQEVLEDRFDRVRVIAVEHR